MDFLMKKFVLITNFILLFYIPVVKSQVTFTISSSAKIGDSARFFCNVTKTPGLNQFNVNFYHNNSKIAIVYGTIKDLESDENTSVIDTENQSYYMYTISSLSCPLRGDYKCGWVSQNGEEKSNTEALNVVGSPGTPNLTVPSGNQILNDNLTVFCESNVGNPAQELKLCIDNNCAKPNPAVEQVDQCIYTQNASLTIQVTKTTRTATCTVESSSLEATKTWDVDYPVDAIKLLPEEVNVRLPRGTRRKYQCAALGNPTPTIMWEFFPQLFLSSTITWDKSVDLDPNTSGVYVCTATNTVGGISYNLTKTLTVTVYDPPTVPPPTTKGPSTTNPSSTTKKAGATAAPSTDKNKIIIGSIIPILIIIIIVIVVIILYKRRAKPSEIEEPPEKPRNNHSEVNMMNTKPDLVHSTGIEKKVAMYNNGFDHGGEDDLSSMKVNFDDKPRSRKPVIPISSPDNYNTLPCV